MKKWHLIYIVLIITFLSCSKDNDAKLEGRWQGISIESPRNSVQSDSLFWSFDRGVCQVQTLQSTTPHYAERIYANYLLEDNLVRISIPNNYLYLATQNRYLDWSTPERKFEIRELTNNSLKLSVNDTIYSFRKYY